MAKKKKKKYQYDPWDAEQEFLPGGSAAKEMRERERDAQTRGHTSWGYEPEKHSYNTKADIEAFKPIESQTYKRYVASIGSDINKAGVRGVRSYLSKRDLKPKNYFDTARYFRALSGTDFTMKTKSQVNRDFKKDVDKRYSLKRIIDKASRLNAGNTKDLIRRSYNDINAVRELGIVNKDADSLLKDIEKYRKAYGNNKDIDTASNYVQQISQMIKQQAKGGSAVSNKALEQWNAPLVKSPYDTKTKTKADIERQYELINELNLQEKYGKPGNLGYGGLKRQKAKTPAEKEWLETNKVKQDPFKKYEDNIKEIRELEDKNSVDNVNINYDSRLKSERKEINKQANNERIKELKQENAMIMGAYAENLIKKAKLTDKERRRLENGNDRGLDNNDNFIWDIGKKTVNEKELTKDQMIDVLNKRGLTKEEASLVLDYSKELNKQTEREVAIKAGELKRRTSGEMGNLVEDIARTVGNPLISAGNKLLGVDGEYQHYEELGRAKEKERQYKGDPVESAVYDFAETVGTIAGASLYGGASAIPFTTKAAEDSYYNALDKGATQDEAKDYAGLTALTTGLIYSIGLKGLNKLSKAAIKGESGVVNSLAKEIVEGKPTTTLGKAIVKDIGKNAIKEGATFAGLTTTTQVADILGQAATLGSSADVKKMVQAYKDNGLNEDEAWKNTVLDLSKEIGKNALSSFASGAVMGAGASLIGGLRQASTYAEMQDEAETLRPEYEKYTSAKNSPFFEGVETPEELKAQYKQQVSKLHPDVEGGSEEAFKSLSAEKERIEGILTGDYSLDAKRAIDKWETLVNKARKILGEPEQMTTKMKEDFVKEYGEVRDNLLETKLKVEGTRAETPEEAVEIKDVTRTIENEIAKADEVYADLTKDEPISLPTAKSKEVNLDNLTDREAEVLQSASDYDLPEKATKSMLANDSESISPQEYANGFNSFYLMGKSTSVESFNDALAKYPYLEEVASRITPQAAGVAFSEGRLETPKAKVESVLKQKPKGEFAMDFEPRDMDERYTMRVLENLTKLNGGNTIIVDDISQYNVPKNTQGFTKLSEGKTVIQRDVANIVGVWLHENIGHLGKAFAKDTYKQVEGIAEDIAVNSLGIRGLDKQIKDLQQEYKNAGQDISYDEAKEEVISYYLETLPLNPELAEKIVEETTKSNMSDAEKKHIIDTILEWIRNAAKAIKERLSKARARQGYEGALREDLVNTEETTNAILNVLEETRQYFENAKVDGSNVETNKKYSMTTEQQELSTEYNKAVADNDMNKAAELVKEYAASKGYDTKVYHGTKDFGFTQIDLDKSDDKTTFWATDNLETAGTYSDRETVRQVSESYKEEDLEKLSNRQLDKLLFTPDSKFEIIQSNNIKKRNQILDNSFNKLFRNAKEYKKENNDRIKEVKKLYNNWKNSNNINAVKKYFKDNPYGLISEGWYDVSIPDKSYGNLVNKVNQLFNEGYNAKLFYDNEYDVIYNYDKENIIKRLVEEYQPYGNYEFYANTDNFMELDAEGKNWNEIEFNTRESIEDLTNKEIVKLLKKQPANIDAKYDKDNDKFLVKRYGNKTYTPLNRTYAAYELGLAHKESISSTRDIAEYAKDKNYDGLLIENVKDHGGALKDEISPANVYIFFNPTEQVKSADPITYDDNGEVVPLEKRFDKDYNDIRYSLEQQEEDKNYSLINKETQEEIDKFEEIGQDIGRQFKILPGSKLDNKQTRQLALDTKKKLESDIDTYELSYQLKSLGALIESKKGDINNTDVQDKAKQIVRDTMKETKYVNEETQNVLRYIRSTKLQVTDKLKGDIPDYNEFRKMNFGTLNLTKDGEPIDTWIAEAAELHPYPFSEWVDKTPSDILQELSNWIASAKEGDYTMYEMGGEDAVDFYALELLNDYANAKVEDVTNSPAKQKELYENYDKLLDFAKEQAEAVGQEKQDAVYKVNKAIENYKKNSSEIQMKLDEQKRDLQDKFSKAMEEEIKKVKNVASEKQKKAIARIKANNREQQRKRTDSRKRTEKRQVIRRTVGRIETTLKKPTVHKYVPQPLQKPVMDLVLSLKKTLEQNAREASIRRDNAYLKYTGERLAQELEKIDKRENKWVDDLNKLNKTLEMYVSGNVTDSSGNKLNNPYGDSDTYFGPLVKMTNDFVNRNGKTPLNKMTLEQLQELSNLTRAIEKTTTERERPQNIKIINKETNKPYETYKEISNAVIKEIEKYKVDGLDKKMLPMLNARSLLKLIGGHVKGGVADQLADQLDERSLVKWDIEKNLNSKFDKVISEKEGKTKFKSEEVRRFDKDHLYNVGFKDNKGETVLHNKDNLLDIYMHLLDDDNMTHIAGGGLNVPAFKKYYGNKSHNEIYSEANGAKHTANLDEQLKTLNEQIAQANENEDWETLQKLAANKANLFTQSKKDLREIKKNIEDTFTDYDKKLIKTGKEIKKQITDMLNDYWEEHFGYRPFFVENHWHISVDPDFISGDSGKRQEVITNLSEQGFTIARQKNATNPIDSGSFIDNIYRDIEQAAKTIAYAGWQRDFNAIYKYTHSGPINWQNVVRNKLAVSRDYFDDAQLNIFGGKQNSNNRFDKLAGDLRSGAISGAVNRLSVGVAQVWSGLGVRMFADKKAMANAFNPKNKISRTVNGKHYSIQDVIDEYTPIMWARGNSGFSLETQDLKRDTNKFFKARRKADILTHGWIFNLPTHFDSGTLHFKFRALLDYVRRTRPDLEEGTPEQIVNGESPLYKEVAKIFNECVMLTDPMFDAVSKNYLQSSRSEIVKSLASVFKTEPYQMANLLYNAKKDYDFTKNDKNATKKEKSKALKFLKGAIAFYFASTTLYAVAKMAYKKLWGHDKREITPGYVAKNLISAYTGFIPLSSQLIDLVYNKIVGIPAYNVEIMGTQLIKDSSDFADAISKFIADPEANVGKFIDNIEQAANDFGIPIKNLHEEVDGIFRNIIDLTDNGKRDYSNEKTEQELYQDYAKGEYSQDDLKQLGIEFGEGNKQKIANAIEKVFLDGDITEDQAIKDLDNTGLFKPGGSFKNVPYNTYIEGKVARWEINAYKEDYQNSLTSGGAETAESRQIRQKIAKLDWNSAFYSTENAKKTPSEKLEDMFKKWRDSREQ